MPDRSSASLGIQRELRLNLSIIGNAKGARTVQDLMRRPSTAFSTDATRHDPERMY
jgi:hypothetical protein